jgi:hypothetical protein
VLVGRVEIGGQLLIDDFPKHLGEHRLPRGFELLVFDHHHLECQLRQRVELGRLGNVEQQLFPGRQRLVQRPVPGQWQRLFERGARW